MSQFDYQGILNDVTIPLLRLFGNPDGCIVRRHVQGTYDPVNDTTTGDTVENHSGLCVQGRFKRDETVNGVTVEQGDVKLILITQDEYLPQPNDTVIFGGNNFRVKNTGSVNPGGDLAVLYICQTVPDYG